MNISAFTEADHFLPDWFDVTCFYLFAYFIGMTLFYFTWFLNFLLNYFAVPLMVMSVTVSRQVNTLLNELILTTLTCALSFQHCLVRTQYGNKEYLLVATSAEMVLHYMVQMLRIDGGRSVTAVVVKYLSKEISFCIAIICAILQVVAVLTVGKFVQLLWHLQGFAELFEHYHPTRCVTDLKVSTTCGFITEGAATMFLVWVNLQHSSVSLYARSFIPALMVIAGSNAKMNLALLKIHSYFTPSSLPPGFLGALFFYQTVFLSSFILQCVTSLHYSAKLKLLLYDLISTVSVCAVVFEHVLIKEHYGNLVLYITGFIVAIELEWIQMKHGGASCCTDIIILYLDKKIKAQDFSIRMGLQIVSIPFVVQFVRFVWLLENSQDYFEVYKSENCRSDLTVSTMQGILIEGLSTMFLIWLSLQDLPKIMFFNVFVNASTPILMVIAGSSYTGMYMHPTLASAMTFGCKGETICDHIMVYWAAPIIGCTMAYYLHRCITG